MSSFKRRSPASQSSSSLPGCRPSLYNSLPLTSTGVPSLDDLLGGGVPLGSSILVAEDADGSSAKLLLRYWISQGLVAGQEVVVVGSSLEEGGGPDEIVNRLIGTADEAATAPGLDKGKAKAEESDGEEPGGRMKIAWRYEGMGKHEDGPDAPRPTRALSEQTPYCADFAIAKALVLTPDMSARLHLVDVAGEPLVGVLAQLNAVLRRRSGRATRVAVQSLDSPGWCQSNDADLYSFAASLRALLRGEAAAQATAAAMLTFPGSLHSAALLRKLQWATDGCIALESFTGNLASQLAFPNHQGIVTLPRLPTFQSFVPPATKTSSLRGGVSNLGFRVGRRRGLKIELMDLGLEGGVSERRTEPPPVDPTATARPAARNEKAEEATMAEVKVDSSPRKGGLKKARPKVRFGGEDEEDMFTMPRADLRNTDW